jgi:hypothetical protein
MESPELFSSATRRISLSIEANGSCHTFSRKPGTSSAEKNRRGCSARADTVEIQKMMRNLIDSIGGKEA